MGDRYVYWPGEEQIEQQCRLVPCPICTVSADVACFYGSRVGDAHSHFGRYEAAAELGLVRPIAIPKESVQEWLSQLIG